MGTWAFSTRVLARCGEREDPERWDSSARSRWGRRKLKGGAGVEALSLSSVTHTRTTSTTFPSPSRHPHRRMYFLAYCSFSSYACVALSSGGDVATRVANCYTYVTRHSTNCLPSQRRTNASFGPACSHQRCSPRAVLLTVSFLPFNLMVRLGELLLLVRAKEDPRSPNTRPPPSPRTCLANLLLTSASYRFRK